LDEFAVFDGLEGLINKSLVTVQHPLQAEARYGMLESIRQYAQGKLIEAGEAGTLRERHVDYFVALVDAYGEQGIGQDYYFWRDRLALEGDNLRAVMDWIAEDRPGLALHFAGILQRFETGWMHYREARSWLEPTIEKARKLLENKSADIDMTDFIRALQAYGWLLVTHGDMINGHAILDESIRLAREFEEFRILAFALGMQAQAMGTGVTWEVIEQLNEAIALSRRDGYEIELLMLLFSAGQAYLARNDLQKGKEHLDQAIQMLEELDLPYMNAWAYIAHANLAAAFQDMNTAEEYLLLASDTYGKSGDQRMAATARSMLAHIYRNSGRLDEALALYRQTILAWQEQGHQSAVAHQLECFAYIAMVGQQYEHAAQLLGAAQKARERLNARSTDLWEIDELGRAMRQLELEMGASELERMLNKGELMSLDEAVALASVDELPESSRGVLMNENSTFRARF
jgi:tetratricopeptide (TPR) repeat protein